MILQNGKGTVYYKIGSIMYAGYFIDDNLEGKGKYIYENGEYYIGEFKNITIKMEISNMMAILIMIKEMEKGNIFMKMVNIM